MTMKFSHSKHFWTWFQKNSDLLLILPQMGEAEKEYWIREVATHLRAYTKNLFCEFLFNKGGHMELVITAYGREKYFRMAENFVAKAPRILGWKITALQPPGMLRSVLVAMYGHAGIDVENLWFLPPGHTVGKEKINLRVYGELYKEATVEMRTSVEAVLFNLVGEKTMGLHVENFTVGSVYNLSPEAKDRLLKIEEFPAWLDNNTLSDWVVNEKGELEKRKE
jgi:hypothetical protein